jgi:hypothetical protein
MQGGQLHRHTGAQRRRSVAAAARLAADRLDRGPVGGEITFSIGRGQRRLAEHVEGIQRTVWAARADAPQGVLDVAAHHELGAHDAHGVTDRGADHRFGGARHQPRQHRAHVMHVRRWNADDAPGQHQPPGAGVDEQRVAPTEVLLPVGLGQAVGDQRLGSGVIGDAQQRLGQAHQSDAFFGRKVVLDHEGVQRGLLVAQRAHPLDPVQSLGHHAGCGIRRQRGDVQQTIDEGSLVGQPVAGQGVTQRIGRRTRNTLKTDFADAGITS